MDDARERLARMIGGEELCFGPSTTQNVYVLAQAFADWLKPSDVVIVTNQDHEANSGAWRKLVGRGVQIREWKIDPVTGKLSLDDLEGLLDERVKLICFPHCSNVIGHINPVAEICKMARSVGAFTCVDGVSYAPHGVPNVHQLGADIYMFSAYKTYGPHQGIMVVRRALGMALPNQAHSFNGGSPAKRFTSAGPDHAQVAASAGIADYFDALYKHHLKAGRDSAGRGFCVHDLMRRHEVKLTQPLLDYLADRSDIRVLGPTDASGRAPMIALDIDRDPAQVARDLGKLGIMAGPAIFMRCGPAGDGDLPQTRCAAVVVCALYICFRH